MRYGRLSELWLRIKLLWRREQLDRDLNDELAFHLAKRERDNRAAGMDATEAETMSSRSIWQSASGTIAPREWMRLRRSTQRGERSATLRG